MNPIQIPKKMVLFTRNQEVLYSLLRSPFVPLARGPVCRFRRGFSTLIVNREFFWKLLY